MFWLNEVKDFSFVPFYEAGSRFDSSYFTSSCSRYCCKSSSCHPVEKRKEHQWLLYRDSDNLRAVKYKPRPHREKFKLIFSTFFFSSWNFSVSNEPIWKGINSRRVGSDLDSLPRHSRAGLDLPLAVSVRVQVESLGDLAGRRRCGQILLISKNQNWNALKVLLIDQLGQLLYRQLLLVEGKLWEVNIYWVWLSLLINKTQVLKHIYFKAFIELKRTAMIYGFSGKSLFWFQFNPNS